MDVCSHDDGRCTDFRNEPPDVMGGCLPDRAKFVVLRESRGILPVTVAANFRHSCCTNYRRQLRPNELALSPCLRNIVPLPQLYFVPTEPFGNEE